MYITIKLGFTYKDFPAVSLLWSTLYFFPHSQHHNTALAHSLTHQPRELSQALGCDTAGTRGPEGMQTFAHVQVTLRRGGTGCGLECVGQSGPLPEPLGLRGYSWGL